MCLEVPTSRRWGGQHLEAENEYASHKASSDCRARRGRRGFTSRGPRGRVDYADRLARRQGAGLLLHRHERYDDQLERRELQGGQDEACGAERRRDNLHHKPRGRHTEHLLYHEPVRPLHQGDEELQHQVHRRWFARSHERRGLRRHRGRPHLPQPYGHERGHQSRVRQQ